ncbi:MAG: DUF3386 family protein [Planctomycetota bacterium]
MNQTLLHTRSIRRSAIASLFAACALIELASGAHAHFLWQRVQPGPKPRADVTFAERPDERVNAVPIERLATARAWDAQGQPLALTAQSGVLGAELRVDALAAGASQSWGIVDRTGDGTGAFLLEYYAKGAATLTEAATRVKLPLEVFASADGAGMVASVRQGDAALANVSLHVQLPSGDTLDRITDAEGRVRLDTRMAGEYGLRARWIEPREGDVDGKAFHEVRHYSTLTFTIGAASDRSTVPAAAPKASSAPAKADPKAYALLEGAHNSRQVLPADYPGFRCELTYRDAGKTWNGTLTYRRKGETEVQIDGLDAAGVKWVRDQLLNLTGHRRGGPFAEGDGKYPLELAPADDSQYGQLIRVHDKTDSEYRVKDNKVHEVTRTMDGSRFTISVLETMEGDAGKYMANHFIVSYRDAETGALEKVDGYRDSYEHIDDLWLPTQRIVIGVGESTSPNVRMIRLRKHQALEKGAE